MTAPSITFQSITFSDGTTIELEANDVVALVGPNNSGKSLALRELEMHLGSPTGTIVVKSTEKSERGAPKTFAEFILKHVHVKVEGSRWFYHGLRVGLGTQSEPEQLWPQHISDFGPLFCGRISTETRIIDSNSVEAIDVVTESFSHPIHMVYTDDDLEKRISGYFRRAFGKELILDRAAGKNLHLYVGDRVSPHAGEDRVSKGFVERLRALTVPLDGQGDGMRSFASVVLHLLAPTSYSLLLLDEPEAFLHPSQARLLGEIIATEKPIRAQLFLATHSPDVLQGLTNVAPGHLRILRIQREGNVNRIKELDKALVKELSSDSLLKYSSVMSGLFHERVFICESDADCMFYNSILDLPEVHGETHPDVHFVHTSGKARMAKLAEILVALDLPVDIIADIDVIRDLSDLKRIVAALGGDWSRLGQLANLLKKEIENNVVTLSLDDAQVRVRMLLDESSDERNTVNKLKSRIDEIFQESKPWSAIKRAGKYALPRGYASQRFDELLALCAQLGLWIVPVGELEGFCPSTGRKGPAWVQKVIEERDLAIDPELESAREFVRKIWEAKRTQETGLTV